MLGAAAINGVKWNETSATQNEYNKIRKKSLTAKLKTKQKQKQYNSRKRRKHWKVHHLSNGEFRKEINLEKCI